MTMAELRAFAAPPKRKGRDLKFESCQDFVDTCPGLLGMVSIFAGIICFSCALFAPSTPARRAVALQDEAVMHASSYLRDMVRDNNIESVTSIGCADLRLLSDWSPPGYHCYDSQTATVAAARRKFRRLPNDTFNELGLSASPPKADMTVLVLGRHDMQHSAEELLAQSFASSRRFVVVLSGARRAVQKKMPEATRRYLKEFKLVRNESAPSELAIYRARTDSGPKGQASLARGRGRARTTKASRGKHAAATSLTNTSFRVAGA